MQKLIYSILVLFTLTSTAQNLKVIYKNEIVSKNIIVLKETYSELLLINNLAWFYFEKEPKRFNNVNSYYYDLDSKTNYMVFPASKLLGLEQLYLVPQADKVNWEITPEKKVVAGYICYKATGTYTNMATGNTNAIEAWFTKELPYAIGPNGVAGLPGLILACATHEFKLVAVEVEKNEILEPIQLPPYPTVSQEEINKIIDAKIGHFNKISN